MNELVKSADISKGAFYHYFTSKEQIFEEVVLSFYKSARIPDFDLLSTTSLHDFYKNWLQHFFKTKLGILTSADGAFSQNHYYLIFDGLRLLPSFREIFEKEQKREIAAWTKIIDIAKQNGEINTDLASKQIAKMFTYVSDGVGSTLLLNNQLPMLKSEATKAWDSIYTLIKG